MQGDQPKEWRVTNPTTGGREPQYSHLLSCLSTPNAGLFRRVWKTCVNRSSCSANHPRAVGRHDTNWSVVRIQSSLQKYLPSSHGSYGFGSCFQQSAEGLRNGSDCLCIFSSFCCEFALRTRAPRDRHVEKTHTNHTNRSTNHPQTIGKTGTNHTNH